MCKESCGPFFFALQMPSGLLQEPLDQLPGADPKVLVSMAASTHTVHSAAASSAYGYPRGCLVYTQPFLKKPPTSVNDLCARVDLEKLFLILAVCES